MTTSAVDGEVERLVRAGNDAYSLWCGRHRHDDPVCLDGMPQIVRAVLAALSAQPAGERAQIVRWLRTDAAVEGLPRSIEAAVIYAQQIEDGKHLAKLMYEKHGTTW